MLLKAIDDVLASYPLNVHFRQLLGFIAADDAMKDQRWVAYLLATIRHETSFTFAPIEEYGKGAGQPYGKADPVTGQAYYGRGYIQLTWKANYQRFADLLKLDLVGNPSLALDPTSSYRIASLGMVEGLFTGAALGHYINESQCDYVNARRIVNGLDQAEKIAEYAEAFSKCLL
jgi:putative chitinase